MHLTAGKVSLMTTAMFGHVTPVRMTVKSESEMLLELRAQYDSCWAFWAIHYGFGSDLGKLAPIAFRRVTMVQYHAAG